MKIPILMKNTLFHMEYLYYIYILISYIYISYPMKWNQDFSIPRIINPTIFHTKNQSTNYFPMVMLHHILRFWTYQESSWPPLLLPSSPFEPSRGPCSRGNSLGPSLQPHSSPDTKKAGWNWGGVNQKLLYNSLGFHGELMVI